MRLDGTNRQRLTRSGAGFDFDPAWSPDGRQIVFRTSRYPNQSNRDGLMIVNFGGTGERALVPFSSFASWSPDGRYVAFSGEGARIAIVRPDGSDLRVLPITGECLEWSPDGRMLAFCRLAGTKWDVWVANADGSRPRRLTSTAGNNYARGWSPDSRQVVVWTQGNGPERLYVADVRGDAAMRALTPYTAPSEIFVAWPAPNRLVIGVSSEADGIHGWFAVDRRGRHARPVLGSLRRSCCGEGQVAWRE